MKNQTTPRVSRSTHSKQDDIIAGLMADARGNAKALRVMPKVLKGILEEVHGVPFKVTFGDDLASIFIVRDREAI